MDYGGLLRYVDVSQDNYENLFVEIIYSNNKRVQSYLTIFEIASDYIVPPKTSLMDVLGPQWHVQRNVVVFLNNDKRQHATHIGLKAALTKH